MKRFVTMMIACLGTIAVLPATTPISMTPLGTVKSGPLTGADPRIAEINAYDVWGRRIYVVNPIVGHARRDRRGRPGRANTRPAGEYRRRL